MKVVIFIDGGYLNKLAERYKLKIDYSRLPEVLIPGHDFHLVRTYYYDCLPYQSDPPSQEERERLSRKQKFFDFLNKLPRFEVKLGKLAKRGDKNNPIFIQKGVDVLMAVDMLKLAATKQVDQIIMVAGDSDFVPVVKAVKEFGVGVILWHGEKETYHDELWKECDERHKLTKSFLEKIKLNS